MVWQGIEGQLREKEGEIEHIKQLGTSLMEPHSPTAGDRPVADTVQALNDRWRALDSQVKQHFSLNLLLFGKDFVACKEQAEVHKRSQLL